MSSHVKAMIVLLEHPLFERLLKPILVLERASVEWDCLSYGELSGGEKAALSWAYGIWTGGPVPKGWRDPFEGFGVMDAQLQRTIMNAMFTRHY